MNSLLHREIVIKTEFINRSMIGKKFPRDDPLCVFNCNYNACHVNIAISS